MYNEYIQCVCAKKKKLEKYKHKETIIDNKINCIIFFFFFFLDKHHLKLTSI